MAHWKYSTARFKVATSFYEYANLFDILTLDAFAKRPLMDHLWRNRCYSDLFAVIGYASNYYYRLVWTMFGRLFKMRLGGTDFIFKVLIIFFFGNTLQWYLWIAILFI